MNKNIRFFQMLVLSATFACLFACTGIKNYKYFEDLPDSLIANRIPTPQYSEPKIQSDDILYIAIQTLDVGSGNSINALNGLSSPPSNLVNNGLTAGNITSNQSTTYGYLVNKNGNVSIPVLGDILVRGLTTQEARLAIKNQADNFYKNSSIIVRFANFKFTILGEVQRPGTYTVANERISLLDALGYAGDLTIFGKRDNVLLLRRQEDGNTLVTRLNLNKSELLKSPYFYIQQNDQIYVEPNKAKLNNSDGTQARTISIVSAVLSLLIIIATRL